MLISFSWLKEHVELPGTLTPEEVAEKLKLSTVEVEGIVRSGQPLDNIVVGKVLSAEKHPNADKLKVCKVDVGTEKLDIVCGGSNVDAGMFVVVAKNGAQVKWHGEGDLITLEPTKIRGVESNGMICGADEVGLAERFPKKDEKEIVDLSGLKVKAGQPLAELVGWGDVVFEIDNKSLSNRPDLWGHYGLAREVAALTENELKPYEVKAIKKGGEQALTVEIEDEKLCNRYMAVVVNNVRVSPSPAWLAEKLTATGIRPINNVVDIMNYVMLDLGQPLHAFDARYVPGGKIHVRTAEQGEKLLCLDEKERALTNEMVVIANDAKAIAVAGIIGGLESGVQADTTTIVIESANFNATSIRKTSTKLGLRTDASARFEKALDPNMCEIALAKAIELLQGVMPDAKPASKVIEKGATRTEITLKIPVGFFEQKLGFELDAKKTVRMLERLGFKIKTSAKEWTVVVPTWRSKDVARAEDLVEEVVRMYGYDLVPSVLPTFPIVPVKPDALRSLSKQVLDLLVREEGYTEVYNYSFVSEKQIVKMGETTGAYLRLDNPLSSEKPYLRRDLVLNLLENVETNMAGRNEVKLVEIGKVYKQEVSGLLAEKNNNELLPRQDTYLTAVVSQKKNTNPFILVRQLAESMQGLVGQALQIKPVREKIQGAHPARQADLVYQGTAVGSLYELHPFVVNQVGLTERIGIITLNLSVVAERFNGVKKSYKPASPYPEVRRDIALVVKKETTYEQVEKAIRSADKLLTNIELFDVYEGSNVGKGYKSLALHLSFGHNERTLTSEEVDKAFASISEVLQKKVSAEVR